MKLKICILDYGSGNVKSVFNACSMLAETVVSNQEAEIEGATHVMLPGVGSFGKAMEKIHELIPVDFLVDQVLNHGKPFLGICVGMQVMLTKGFEFGEWNGLNLISGRVDLIDTDLLLPHVGWNELQVLNPTPITSGLPDKADFYFVHSYKASLENSVEVLAETSYGVKIPAIIKASGTNAFGVQFHPEKSQGSGIRVLENFLSVAL